MGGAARHTGEHPAAAIGSGGGTGLVEQEQSGTMAAMVMTPTSPIPAGPRASATRPRTPTVGGWHFPGASAGHAGAAAVPLTISTGVGFQRSRRPRFSASSSSSSSYSHSPCEFPGVSSKQPSRHSFGGFQNSSSAPLPYCSPTCRDCPTSSRLLLVLHNIKEGSGVTPDRAWSHHRPASEHVPNERSRWSRVSSTGSRRPRATTAAVSSEKLNRSSSTSTSEPMVAPFNVLITGSTKGITSESERLPLCFNLIV